MLLLQVTVNDLDPGIVVITVKATTLPLQQTYSLVVQGQFSGQLADPYNPGWDHTASTVGVQWHIKMQFRGISPDLPSMLHLQTWPCCA